MGELSASTLPTDLALEPAHSDATEPVSTPSATTTDAGHIAPGTTDADTFLPSLAGTPRDEVHR